MLIMIQIAVMAVVFTAAVSIGLSFITRDTSSSVRKNQRHFVSKHKHA